MKKSNIEKKYVEKSGLYVQALPLQGGTYVPTLHAQKPITDEFYMSIGKGLTNKLDTKSK